MNKHHVTATVSKILNFSCVDGPGSRLVIFLQGCNFKCRNCHNPHTIGLCDHCGDCIKHCPSQALRFTSATDGKARISWNADACSHCDTCLAVCPRQSNPKTREYTVDEMLAVIHNNSLFISGITVTGGEATLQLNFIVELFTAIKSSNELRHLSCMIDSNGSLSEPGWQKVLPVLDGAMIDLKAWQQQTHYWLTGREHHRVFKTIALLSQHRKLHEVRLLYIPTITDFDTEIDAIGKYLSAMPVQTRIRLNAFQHHGVTGEALNWPVCGKEELEDFAQALELRGVKNVIRPGFIMGGVY